MRLLVVMIGTLAFLSTTVDAQQWLPAQRNGAGSGLPYAKESSTQTYRTKIRPPAENEYRAGLKEIPDKKGGFDPWRNAR